MGLAATANNLCKAALGEFQELLNRVMDAIANLARANCLRMKGRNEWTALTPERLFRLAPGRPCSSILANCEPGKTVVGTICVSGLAFSVYWFRSFLEQPSLLAAQSLTSSVSSFFNILRISIGQSSWNAHIHQIFQSGCVDNKSNLDSIKFRISSSQSSNKLPTIFDTKFSLIAFVKSLQMSESVID